MLDEELRLNKCSSFELIEQYYLEKISHQVCNQADKGKRIDFTCARTGGIITVELKTPVSVFQKTLKHTRYGRISVKCYYDAPEQRLTVEILHAADIMALDANGRGAAFWWLEASLTAVSPPRRSERSLCHRGALPPPPLPHGQEPAHAGQAEDAAPGLRRALLLVSPAACCACCDPPRRPLIPPPPCPPATSVPNTTGTASPV